MDKVPEIARRYGMTVSLGIWISPDLEKNEKEIELGIKVALANRRIIDRVIVGNESILLGYVTPDQLNDYIERVRAALPARIKVTTAEPWSTWLLTPEIGQYVDVIFVHLLPYWEGMAVRDAHAASWSAPITTCRRISGQADRHRRSRLAVRRPHPPHRRSLRCQRGLFRAQLRPAGVERATTIT